MFPTAFCNAISAVRISEPKRAILEEPSDTAKAFLGRRFLGSGFPGRYPVLSGRMLDAPAGLPFSTSAAYPLTILTGTLLTLALSAAAKR